VATLRRRRAAIDVQLTDEQMRAQRAEEEVEALTQQVGPRTCLTRTWRPAGPSCGRGVREHRRLIWQVFHAHEERDAARAEARGASETIAAMQERTAC
jgi:hypothetical protein